MTDEELEELWKLDGAAPRLTPDAVRAASARFARRVALRNVREWAASVLVIAFFGWHVASARDALVRAGAALTVAATVFVSATLFRRGRPADAPPPDAPTSEHLAHHRRELLRQRDLLARAWLWYVTPFLPGMVLWFWGFGGRGSTLVFVLAGGLCAAVLLGVAMLNRAGARRLEAAASALDGELE